MIALIDINIGNLNSVEKALKYLNVEYKVVSDAASLATCSKIIFPGVGNFSAASNKLKKSHLTAALKREVQENNKPFLGICLGMQLLAIKSSEGGVSPGLGLLDAEVERIPSADGYPVPHIGWNSFGHYGLGLFEGIDANTDFYFVHSYRMVVNDPEVKYFCTDYGGEIVAFVQQGNIFGAQFHPEIGRAHV